MSKSQNSGGYWHQDQQEADILANEGHEHQETVQKTDINIEMGNAALQSADIEPTQDEGSTSEEDAVTWEASEYIHHQKGMVWYVALGAMALVLVALAVFFQQYIFAILIIVLAVAFGMYAQRPPRILHYQLSSHGLTIESNSYPYQQFKSFGVVKDGPLYSVVLVPTKRLMPSTVMYFEQSDGERIVDVLSRHLPMEEMKLDFIEQLMRKIRF